MFDFFAFLYTSQDNPYKKAYNDCQKWSWTKDAWQNIVLHFNDKKVISDVNTRLKPKIKCIEKAVLENNPESHIQVKSTMEKISPGVVHS